MTKHHWILLVFRRNDMKRKKTKKTKTKIKTKRKLCTRRGSIPKDYTQYYLLYLSHFESFVITSSTV